MKYPYIVIKDGVWYKAGDEVPEDSKNPAPPNYMAPLTSNYTKTEINRMSTSDLQGLAKMYGIDNSEEISGSELKKILISKFGL
jgi:hypothetical protein